MQGIMWSKLGYTIKAGKLMQIPLKIHWTILIYFLFVPAYVFYQSGGWEEALILCVLFVLIMGSVVLHELGHAYAARLQGIKTHDIVISLIGGIARLEKIPEEPKEELKIAIAGPVVNLFIFGFLGSILGILFYSGVIQLIPNFKDLINPEVYISDYEPPLGVILLYIIAFANIILFLFNLIPIFPMDGGRILRAILAFSLPRLKATNIAAIIGKVLSLCLVIIGLIYFQPIWAFIGMFVFFMADNERRQTAYTEKLKNITCLSVAITAFKEIRLFTSMEKIIEDYFDGIKYFVVVENNRIQGFIDEHIIEQALRIKDNNSLANLYMSTRFAMVNSNESILSARKTFQSGNFPICLVMNEGKLEGLISYEQINKI